MSQEIVKEISDCSPTVVEHFVGQRHIVSRVNVALNAAWNDTARLSHMLLSGPAGLGKTQLAHVLANEMGMDGKLHEQLAQNIKTPADLHALLLTPSDREVVLIDEIHELPPIAQTTLYRVMENQQIFLETKRGKRSKPLKIANFTVLGCSTDQFRLLKPLRDRFQMILEFEYYQASELAVLVEQRCKLLRWQIEPGVIREIASRGQGVPRICLRILESCRRTARSRSHECIRMDHLLVTCQMEGLDNLGLTPLQRKYLGVIREHEREVRLNIVATRLGLHPRMVHQIIEPFLLRIQLIGKNDKGRFLTHKGREHIVKNPIS